MNIATRIPNDLWNAIRNSYEKENYQAAILDSFFLLTELIRQKSGSTADGIRLIGEAFSPNNPKIKITKLETESDKNIQKGYADILRGLYESVRNPRAHGNINDTREDAENIIIFIGYIYNIISESKPFYAPENFMVDIFDENFHNSDKYAELLVEEIPIGKIFETIIYIYRNSAKYISINNILNILPRYRLIFNYLYKKLNDDEYNELSKIFSDTFSKSSDYIFLTIVLSFIDERIWLNIKPVSKIRIENIIARAIEQSTFDESAMDEIYVFGLMSIKLLKYISADTKKALLYILFQKSSKGTDHQNYILYIIKEDIKFITEKMPFFLSNLLVTRLSNHDLDAAEYIAFHLPFDEDTWPDKLKELYNNLER